MKRDGWLGRHGLFLVLIAFLFLTALYVGQYLDSFTYVLRNSRLFFQLFVGVTAIAILKNVVGVKTLGTFAPAIVAIAFLQAGLVFGTILFLNVLVIVIATRELVRRELIQQDHRLAILVIMVGLSIVMLEILAEYFHLPQLNFSFLFPVLIIAWTAERYVEGIDRQGWEAPSKQLFWTFVAVVLAYAIMIQVWLVDFILLTPLTWPFLVLVNWFLGTRVRFRLSERRRFRPVTGKPAAGADEVLTMNVRNREYIAKYNEASLFPILTKARMKTILAARDVPIPDTHLVLEGRADLARLESFLPKADRFVLKPASGYGGEGILVVRGREGDRFRTNQGSMSVREIVAHAQYILTGAFGKDTGDEAIVEALVEQHPALKSFVPEGLADVRVIALLGHPVMAMIRLPTRESKGRANLHSGAVGCGIRLGSGRIVHATWHGSSVERHPDTGAVLTGAEIPFWSQILQIAAKAQCASGLGYAGVDIVLDAARGPLVLEVNKRPGLEIQNANGAGLLKRLRIIERRGDQGTLEERVRVSLDMDARGWEAAA